MSLPIYFQWGHTQSCCWSTGWASTWCPPERTLPERNRKKRAERKTSGSEIFTTRFRLNYAETRSLSLSNRIHSLSRVQTWEAKGRQKLCKGNTCHCCYLLRLQSQFNKDLLQFLVDEVDTELLEAISLPGENTIQSMSYHQHCTSNLCTAVLCRLKTDTWGLTWNISKP